MTDYNETQRGDVPTLSGSLKRRGLIAGAATLVAGLIATRGAEQVAATLGSGDGGPLIIKPETPNRSTGITTLIDAPADVNQPAFRVQISQPNPPPDNKADAIQGYAGGPNNAGVAGRNDELNGLGLVGVGSNGIGVYGQSSGGSAISAAATSGFGVFATATGGTGVRGEAGSGIGVLGVSNTNYGVYGASTGAHGVTGTTTAAGYAGLIGQVGANNTTAISGNADPRFSGSYAAVFSGQVLVIGDFTVTGGRKSAAAKHRDGSHRLLYCVESPDAWFEDFGEGKIVNGRADVQLDSDFIGVVDPATMHVFISEYGENYSLAVSKRDAKGFSVAADAKALVARGVKLTDVNGTFGYRVVAKRADVKSPRLAKIDLPSIKKVDTNISKAPKQVRRPE